MCFEVHFGTICKILYGSTNGGNSYQQRLQVLIDARRFILAWGRKHGRAGEVASFASADPVVMFGLGTDQLTASTGESRKKPHYLNIPIFNASPSGITIFAW